MFFLCYKPKKEFGFLWSRQLRDIYSTTWVPVQKRIIIHVSLVSWDNVSSDRKPVEEMQQRGVVGELEKCPDPSVTVEEKPKRYEERRLVS